MPAEFGFDFLFWSSILKLLGEGLMNTSAAKLIISNLVDIREKWNHVVEFVSVYFITLSQQVGNELPLK